MMDQSNDTSLRAVIRDWIEIAVLSERGLNGQAGIVKLGVGARAGGSSTMDVREWVILPKKPIDAADLASDIYREAELQCEGQGGGTCFFIVRAFRDGPEGRSAFAQRPFTLSLDMNEAMALEEVNDRGVRSDLFKQNQQLHQVLLRTHNNNNAQLTSLTKIIESLSGQLRSHQDMAGDNLVLARINAEQRRLEEAEAYKESKRANRWDDIVRTVMEVGVDVGKPLLQAASAQKMMELQSGEQQNQQQPPTSDQMSNDQVKQLMGMMTQYLEEMPTPEEMRELVGLLPQLRAMSEDKRSGVHLLPDPPKFEDDDNTEYGS